MKYPMPKPKLLIAHLAIFAILLGISHGAYCQSPPSKTTAEAVQANNTGTKLLIEGNFKDSIKYYMDALAINPDYAIAKKNLAVAHNNYGISLRGTPEKALQQFHAALWMDPTKPATRMNIAGAIELMGLNPNRVEDRLRLAKDAEIASDEAGANIELGAADWLKKNPNKDWALNATTDLPHFRSFPAAIAK
jgi:tetratricopeptide (TPR) repeat protein